MPKWRPIRAVRTKGGLNPALPLPKSPVTPAPWSTCGATTPPCPHGGVFSSASWPTRSAAQKSGRTTGHPIQKTGQTITAENGVNGLKAAGQFGLGKAGMNLFVADVVQQHRWPALATFELWDQMMQTLRHIRRDRAQAKWTGWRWITCHAWGSTPKNGSQASKGKAGMNGQPELVMKAVEWLDQAGQIALGWLLSPAAWSQFALLALAYLAARIIAARLSTVLVSVLTPKSETQNLFATVRRFALRFLPLLLPVIAYGLTATGEGLTRSMFGSGEVIAFGKRVFLFLAARALVSDILTDSFLRLLGKYVLIPIAALYALGLLDDVSQRLSDTRVELGNIQFSALSLIRGLIAGALLFWLGSWSNRQSATYIKSQQELRPATRELAVKATEIAIFGAAFLLLMSIMGIDLTAVAVIGGALGVGIGLGLQQIAANFISGIILLVEGQTTVGDYVELDGGEKGTIVKMTARACILETFDGKWIVVPNEHFITTRVTNYSDQGSANRYEAEFSVSYDTDINRIPALIEDAVRALPFVLELPDGPDCELSGFGESSVDFVVEYWVNGIDDGKNRYRSPVLFAIWNALKAEGIEMPYPQRVVHLKPPPTA